MQDMLQVIINETQKIILAKDIPCPDLQKNTEFLKDLPMDSLDLAVLIVTLEDLTQLDPFKEGFKTFHTLGQLADLYENSAP